MMQQLLEQLCAIIETQNGIIKDLATRLHERDDVDLAERIAAAQAQQDEALNGNILAHAQALGKGETTT